MHRIGRTGRCGKTGVATTFINRDCMETTLLDLKHLLIEVGTTQTRKRTESNTFSPAAQNIFFSMNSPFVSDRPTRKYPLS